MHTEFWLVNLSEICQYKTNKIEIPNEKHQMKIYKTMLRLVVTYSSETWTLTAKEENNLRIFERQILREIFGPINIDNIWRTRNNMEIDKLVEGSRYSEIHQGTKNQMAGACSKNGPNKTK